MRHFIARSLAPILIIALLPSVPVQPTFAQTVANPGLFSLNWSSSESELSPRAAWGDMDNDGDLDLAVANYKFASRVYRNENGSFTLAWSSPIERSFGVAWGDYDGDGDLDLMIANGSSFERTDQGGQASRLYRNINGQLETTAAWSTPANRSFGVAWGDADGDGDLDLAVANGGVRTTLFLGQLLLLPVAQANQVYINDTPQGADAAPALTRSITLPGSPDASADIAWGDYDGDGRLDLAVGNLGATTSQGPAGNYDRIYRNTTTTGDPTFVLAQEFTTLDPTFGVAWGEIDGAPGLDLVLGNASTPDPNGSLLPYSNALYRNISATLTLDTNWNPAPLTTLGVALGDYDGDGDLDLATANAAPIGSTEVGAPNYVYENIGGSFANTPVWQTPQRDDSFGVAWGDADNDGDLDLATANAGVLFFANFPGQPNRLYRNEAGVLGQTATTALNSFGLASRAAWGDYDNDGKLDLALGGRGVTANRILRNQNGTFVDSGLDIGISDGFANVAWGDYDGDGKLDLAVSNDGASPDRIYRNTGSGFSPVFSFGAGTETSSLAWGDFDADGDLDLAVSNREQGGVIYRYTPGGFVEHTSFGNGEDLFSVAWADYDNDSDLDLAAGAYGQQNMLYVNNNGQFAVGWRSVEHDLTTSLAWADYDGDGDFDLAVGNIGQPKRIYRNEGGQLSSGPAWSSVESDLTTSLAWGDYDGDGDLDLAAGNGGFSSNAICSSQNGAVNQRNRVYLNTGNDLAQTAFWTSSEAEFTTAVAWGDADNDGDLDLAAATCSGGVSRLYANRRANLAPNGAVPPQITLAQPGGQPAADGLAQASVLTSTIIPISYTLRHAAGQPARLVRFFYSLDGGGNWLPARDSSGSNQRSAQPTSPAGTVYSFAWDTYASGVFGQSDSALLRAEAYANLRPSANGVAGPFQAMAATTTTKPFRLRGTQVQVVDENGVGVPDALVYRLPAGRTRGALPLGGGAGEAPFRTDERGFLQGRGDLTARLPGQSSGGDQLLAMQPVIVTDTYTLYHTSGPISVANGLQMNPVTQPGVQRLTVSANNPLLLFRLDVALEWDARNDTRYMAQLERDLLRTSEILYDYSDGQAALGEINVYHDAKRRLYDGWDLWAFSQVRIYATNRMRPNANKGGNVITPTLDPYSTTNTIEYQPGQVRMGALWNRYGDRSGVLGEDWPRTLAHELGHYLFFLDDNYLGLDAQNVLIAVDNCRGAMSDPYRDEYSEFHPAGEDWNTNCTNTLSERLTERSDWETITTFFPTDRFGLKAPGSYNANPGPEILPLAVSQLAAPQPDPMGNPLAAPLDVPLFTIEGGTSQSARAFVFQGEWLTDLGLPAGNRLDTRGTAVGDRLCVFDLPRQQLGCETVRAGDQTLEMAAIPNWQPEISLTPVTSRTLVVNVSGVAGLPTNASVRLYPLDYPAVPTETLVLNGASYSATLPLVEPIFEGYLHISANDGSGREAVVDFTIGGNPGRLWSRTVTKGNPGRLWSRTAPRANPGRLWSRTAPVISGDGQVIVFTANETFEEGEFYALQTVSQIDNPPPWAVPVGQAYRVTAVAGAPPLTGASISMGYLSAEVPDGAERWLGLYRLRGASWEALSSTVNLEFNLVSAAIDGPGVYAIMASVQLPALSVLGWNNISYPLSTSRPVEQALLSIDGSYSMVYRKDSGLPGERWKLYATGVPTYVNDLLTLDFARNYDIYITRPVTISLRPDLPEAQRQDTTHTAQAADTPSAFYGTISAGNGFIPIAGALVEAEVGGTLCGQGRTEAYNGTIVYVVKVEASCGSGQSVTFRIGGRAMAGTAVWNNNLVQERNLRAGATSNLYLPLIMQ
jgi:hypothetical protein